MAEGALAEVTPLLSSLPDDIVIWEILVRLPPICLLRCRAVGRSWRRVTSTGDFLLAHHDQQPSLPIICEYECPSEQYHYQSILAFDHRAGDAHLQPVARLDDGENLWLLASCDGLLIFSSMSGGGFYICNPATRQYASLWQPRDFRLFTLLGMYLHRPTGEYRLLLHRSSDTGIVKNPLPIRRVGCYILTVGSDQPLRYIGRPQAAWELRVNTPTLVRDNLHWCPEQHQSESRLLLVFDTIAESFRQILAPSAPTNLYVFEIDGTLGIYSYNNAMQIVEIWVLQNYEGEVWEYKYRVELPVAEIRGQLGRRLDDLDVSVVSVDGDVLLLLSHGEWLFYVGTDGKLVDSFLRDGKELFDCQFRLKQTLVPQSFFTTLEGYAVNASPFT